MQAPRRIHWPRFGRLLQAAALIAAGAALGWAQAPAHPTNPEEIQVAPPPLTEGIFPCSGCHDGKAQKPNPIRREMKDMHTDIELKHGPETRWCTDCHDLIDRDKLRLASGDKLDFKVSYQLCGQCHGDKYRDWRVGVHGKRTGSWNGAKQYLLCVSCHNPHSPRFAAIAPMPPPVRPETIQPRKGGVR